MSGLEDRFLALIKNLEEEKRLADKRTKQLYDRITALTGGEDKPCFLAYNSANDANETGDGTPFTVEFDTEIFDQGGDFASPDLTVPIDGRYLLEGTVCLYNLNADSHEKTRIDIVTSNRVYQSFISGLIHDGAGLLTLKISCLVDMDANDTASIRVIVYGGAKSAGILGGIIYTFFSGALIAKEN